ncbi:MAG: NAD(P)/FAD-dependent oxidoreductase, partial [Chitinophagaceae bacterium]
GASAAGLACAACLSKEGIPYILLEQHSQVAHSWRHHYDRLHLNTMKKYSSLPYLPFPEHSPVYVPKNDVVSYLENYLIKCKTLPVFNQTVTSITPKKNDWVVETTTDHYTASNIIVATGYNRKPFLPEWQGMKAYKGVVIHSSAYKNGGSFKGQKVLVIGFGNSACEIGLCLHEHGAFPSLSVQGPVNIVSRGNGTNNMANFLESFAWVSRLAPRLVDSINAPSIRARYGDLQRYGLQKLPYGPNVQIVHYNRAPLLDIGTYELIKKGNIPVYPGVKEFGQETVNFIDGRQQFFDAVVLATGYRSALSDFIPEDLELFDRDGRPFISGSESTRSGIYFCGFKTSPVGMLREIGLEARKIARSLKKKLT